MKPIPIPDELGIQGATKRTISGGDTGAEDVEALVGTTDNGVPFFAMLIEADELDMRSLHLDRRFWLFQLGVPLHPFSLETAFVDAKVDEGDVITDRLEEIGRLLAAAWHLHAAGDSEGLGDVLDAMQMRVHGTETVVRTREATGTAYRPRAGIASSGLRVVADVDVNGRRTGTIEIPMSDGDRETTVRADVVDGKIVVPPRQLDGHVEPPSPTDEDGSDGTPS